MIYLLMVTAHDLIFPSTTTVVHFALVVTPS